MASEFVKGIPILASLNIDKTQSFYEEKLGFKLVGKMDDYIILQRSNLELHLWLAPSRDIAEQTACIVHVRDIEILYNEYKPQGVVVADLETKPWGTYQFVVHDDDGNQITFINVP